jgi:hypothetical protein
MRLNKNKGIPFGGLDTKAALGLILLGVAMLVVAELLQSTVIVLSGIAFIAAPVIYLVLHKRLLFENNEETAEPKSARSNSPISLKILDISFWMLFTIALLLLRQNIETRPLSFLIIVSLLTSIIAIEIFSNKRLIGCLAKIMVLGLLIRASIWFQFSGPIGRDPIQEMNFVRHIISLGHIGPYMQGYKNYPIAAVFIAIVQFASALSLKDSWFILGFIEVISLLFVFLISKEILGKKIALLSILFLAVNNYDIQWGGYWLKAMTLGVALLPFLFYLIINSKKGGSFKVLSVIIIGVIILTHPISSFITMLIIILGLFISLLFSKIYHSSYFIDIYRLFNPRLVLIFGIGLFGYWSFASGSIWYAAESIKKAFTIDTNTLAAPVSAGLELFLQRLPDFVFIFFTILGSLKMISRRESYKNASFVFWFAILSSTLIIITYALNMFPAFSNLVPDRWFVFASIMAAIPVSVGIVFIIPRQRVYGYTLLFVTIFSIALIMTTSSIANVTQVVSWNAQSRDAFTVSEMSAAETLSQISGPQITIHSDYLYMNLMQSEYDIPPNQIIDASSLIEGNSSKFEGLFVLRSSVLDSVLATFSTGHFYYQMTKANYDAFITDPNADIIYEQGDVVFLFKPQ